MPAGRYISNNDIINRVATEIGLTPVTDTFSVEDPAFKQLIYLLTTSVQELMEMFPWQALIREFQHTTVQGGNGEIDLPPDFAYMIDQTGWERKENVPLIGPLTPQDWTYLMGRDLVGSTIYASFRFDQDKLRIFPNDPAPADLDINFEYISSNLIKVAGSDPVTYTDTATVPSDIPQFPAHLITRLLKVKMLEAKGFDSQKAEDNFWQAFYSWSGKDNSAQILNAGRQWRGFPYLDMWRNLPDTGFGQGF